MAKANQDKKLEREPLKDEPTKEEIAYETKLARLYETLELAQVLCPQFAKEALRASIDFPTSITSATWDKVANASFEAAQSILKSFDKISQEKLKETKDDK